MLRGHIDVLTSAGYIMGWAFDAGAPATPVAVAILDEAGDTVAAGLAHHYREDLMAAGCGIGWCEFRLRVEGITRLRRGCLILVENVLGRELHRVAPIPYIETPDEGIRDLETLLAGDPTMALSIAQLRGCDALFRNYIRQRGVEGFVRAAYVYTLGRPADAGGLRRYGRLIRTGALAPFELLSILTESEEFRSRPRLLGAPNGASFPLACA